MTGVRVIEGKIGVIRGETSETTEEMTAPNIAKTTDVMREEAKEEIMIEKMTEEPIETTTKEITIEGMNTKEEMTEETRERTTNEIMIEKTSIEETTEGTRGEKRGRRTGAMQTVANATEAHSAMSTQKSSERTARWLSATPVLNPPSLV
jgi:hypothetical protein